MTEPPWTESGSLGTSPWSQGSKGSCSFPRVTELCKYLLWKTLPCPEPCSQGRRWQGGCSHQAPGMDPSQTQILLLLKGSWPGAPGMLHGDSGSSSEPSGEMLSQPVELVGSRKGTLLLQPLLGHLHRWDIIQGRRERTEGRSTPIPQHPRVQGAWERHAGCSGLLGVHAGLEAPQNPGR